MDICKLIYIISIFAYAFIYYSGGTWMNPEETFAFPRLTFLIAVLFLMDKYVLVPKPLTCPPFYIFYKVVAAVIVANIALVSVWWQMEDFLKWLLASFAGLFEYVPLVNRKLEFGEDPTVIFLLQQSVSLYFLFWVIMSSGYLSQLKGLSSSCGEASTSGNSRSCGQPRRRRPSANRC